MARAMCGEDHKSSSVGFGYSDISSANPTLHHHNQFTNQIQAFENNQSSNQAEIFNLSTSMDHMIGYSKAAAFFSKHGQVGPSSSKGADQFYNENPNPMESWQESTNNNNNNNNRSFMVDEESQLRCVFPCEGNERPSQGLSLSLSSTNPSSIGLQSFELRQTTHHPHQDQTMLLQEGFLGNKTSSGQIGHEDLFQLRNSKYLSPAQELLNEFCTLGNKQTDGLGVSKQKSNKSKQWEDQDDNNNGSTSKNQSLLYSLEFVELQKRKTRLLQMLEEVERRYKHYCDHMKAVVAAFETVASSGAAMVYSKLASKAMSRHFRGLKDGIVAQIQATRKAMGEKGPVAPGASRGETPRLRILDQTLRQRAFQQMNMMESHPWRPQRGLPERSVTVLRAWLFEHFLHPYPSDVDKHILARQTGLSRSQVSNWFINARVRLWKPMVEEMYMEETKEHENNFNNNNNMSTSDDVNTDHIGDSSSHMTRPEDQKPTHDQLVRIDSECLSSIITNNSGEKTTGQMQPQPSFGRVGDAFGASMELDFAGYNQHQGFNSGGGHGVSLTLGLNQHNGTNGVSLAFSPSSQSSLLYPRDQIEECQPVQYSSMLDGEGQNNLPYRNLMGAQLLQDLAG